MPATQKKHNPLQFPPSIRCTLPGCSRRFKNQSARTRHEYSAHPTPFVANTIGLDYGSSPIQPIRVPSPQLEALTSSSENPTLTEGCLESGHHSESYDYDISMLTQDVLMLSICRDELVLQDLDERGRLSRSVTGNDSDEDCGSSSDIDSDIGNYEEKEDNIKVYHNYLNGAYDQVQYSKS